MLRNESHDAHDEGSLVGGVLRNAKGRLSRLLTGVGVTRTPALGALLRRLGLESLEPVPAPVRAPAPASVGDDGPVATTAAIPAIPVVMSCGPCAAKDEAVREAAVAEAAKEDSVVAEPVAAAEAVAAAAAEATSEVEAAPEMETVSEPRPLSEECGAGAEAGEDGSNGEGTDSEQTAADNPDETVAASAADSPTDPENQAAATVPTATAGRAKAARKRTRSGNRRAQRAR
jgi:hypothetical protein